MTALLLSCPSGRAAIVGILSAYLSDESIYVKNVKVRDDFVTWSSLVNKENSRTFDPWRLSVSFASQGYCEELFC